ncbi:MAG: glycosyltransferase [Acidimicrobiia bacterium]
MPGSDVTIVVVPRESFSQSEASLESVLSCTRVPFNLVYVDGNSPRRIRRYLDARARQAGFTLARTDRYVSPNKARNLGFAHVGTPYVAFVDNNTIVTEGWLDSLLRCARETNAAFVAPVYCVGSLNSPVIHTAGGEGHIEIIDGRRQLVDVHHYCDRPLAEVRNEFRRAPCEVAEFHCVLTRTDVVAAMAGFDIGLPAALEHIDFGLQAAASHDGGWFEPEAVVTYLPPPPLAISDAPYFALRWSKDWIDTSFEHFAGKWQLRLDDPGLRGNREWLEKYRWKYLRYLRGGLRRTLGPRAVHTAERVIDRAVSSTLVRANSSGS